MASLEAHYSVSDIEARILAALRAAGLNPEQRLSPIAVGGTSVHLYAPVRLKQRGHTYC